MVKKITLEELNRFLATTSVRVGKDPYEKAIIFLLNHPEGNKLSKKSICCLLNISISNFKERMWSYLKGYTAYEHSTKYYLNKQQEQELTEKIITSENQFNCLSPSEIKTLAINFYYH